MASSPDNPDWSLLPELPAEFFGLETTYDAQDLKRSYNRFLKKFKPERFPQEFQRIREAYEALERMLRYGYRPPPHPGFTGFGQGQPDDVPDRADNPEETLVIVGGRGPRFPTDHAATPVEPPLTERLKTESVEELIASLRGLASPQPQHFLHLAILLDALPDADPHSFFATLLKGLEKWPADHGLGMVMGEYLNRSPLNSRLIADLKLLAKTLRHPVFYQWTEAAWDRIVSGLPFKVFRKALTECEELLPVGDSPHRAVFLAHVLPRAVWTADEAWVNDALAIFDARMVDDIPFILRDVELIEALWAYVRDPARVGNASPQRQQFDKLARVFTDRSDEEAYAAFVRFQSDVQNDETAWLEEFPVRVGFDSTSALTLYRRFESRVAGHMREGLESERDLGADVRRLKLVLKSLETGLRNFSLRSLAWEACALWRKKNSRFAWLAIIFFLGTIPGTLGVAMLSLAMEAAFGSSAVAVVFLIGEIAALALCGLAAARLATPVGQYVDGLVVRIEDRLAWSHYRAKYRPALLQLFPYLGVGYDTSLHLVQGAVLQDGNEELVPITRRMINLWSRDLGSAIVMTSRRYLAS